MPGRLRVGRVALDHEILVRIQARQQITGLHFLDIFSFIPSYKEKLKLKTSWKNLNFLVFLSIFRLGIFLFNSLFCFL